MFFGSVVHKTKASNKLFPSFSSNCPRSKTNYSIMHSCDAVSIGLVRIISCSYPAGLGPGDATCTDTSRHGHRPRACPAASRHRGNHGPDIGHQHSVHVSTEPGHHRPSKTQIKRGSNVDFLQWLNLDVAALAVLDEPL